MVDFPGLTDRHLEKTASGLLTPPFLSEFIGAGHLTDWSYSVRRYGTERGVDLRERDLSPSNV